MLGIRTAVFLVVLVSGYTCDGNVKSCLERRNEECDTGSKQAFRKMKQTFPDEEFLVQNCDRVINNMECTIELNKTCPVPEGIRRQPLREQAALKLFIEEICLETSALRTAYVENVECLNSHAEEIGANSRRQKLLIDVYMVLQELEERIPDEAWTYFGQCLEHTVMTSEIVKTVRSYCGEPAARLATEVASRVYLPIDVICPADDVHIQQYLPLLHELLSQNHSLEALQELLPAK